MQKRESLDTPTRGAHLKDENHVKVAKAVGDALKGDEFDVLQGEQKGRPLHQVNQTVRSGKNFNVRL